MFQTMGGPPGLSFILQNDMLPSSSIIFRTRSHSPILTPPLVRIASQVESESNVVLNSSIESFADSCLTASQPIDSTNEARA